MAPVVAALRGRADRFSTVVCCTGQHRDLLQELGGLRIEPDVDLGLMRPGQGLNTLAGALIHAIDEVLCAQRPDWMVVQGDTTTAMAGAMAAFHRRVGLAHVEAGLRTSDLHQPFPEEANRRIADMLSTVLFAPTERAARALADEGSPPQSIHLVGNTVVDALLAMAGEPEGAPERPEILVTVHRRESFGEPLRRIFTALRELAQRHPDVDWIYPVHPNPNVRGPANEQLSGLPNLSLLSPLPYPDLVRQLRRCRFVLTDSGGIQEEAPTFAKPVLVLRETTERPEGVAAGVARLCGTDTEAIVHAATELLVNESSYRAMARAINPYGDGRAAERIVAVLAGESWDPLTMPS